MKDVLVYHVQWDQQDKYCTDTSVDVIWTCGLSTKSHAVLNTVTGSSLLSAVNTNHVGTYICTAQVVYTGSSLYVLNSIIYPESNAIFCIQIKILVNLLPVNTYWSC